MRITGYLILIIASLLPIGCNRTNDKDGHSAFYSELRDVNKLTLARMTISKMATIDDLKLDEAQGLKQQATALLDAVKIGDRIGVYSYDTYLTAYMDMSALRPEDVVIDESNHTITLNLPPVRTEFSGRDMKMSENHYRVTGLRGNIGPKERAQLKEKMNDHLRKEVEQDSRFIATLTEQARSKATAWFSSLIEQAGYTPVINIPNQ